MFPFPFILGLCGAQFWPLPSSSEKLYELHHHSVCASTQKSWSIFLLLRLAWPAHGVWLCYSPLSLFSFSLSTYHITVLLCARYVFMIALTPDNFLEGAATTLLSFKRCKPGKYLLLSIELAHLKADQIKWQSRLTSIFKWFATIAESQLIYTNFHRGS